MPDWGVTKNGYRPKDFRIIRSELVRQFRKYFGDIRTEPGTAWGMLIDILADREAKIWSLQEDQFYSQFPPTAEGIALDFAISLNGMRRKEATKTFVSNVHLFGDSGTVISEGTELYKENNPDRLFTTVNEVTLSAGAREKFEITWDSLPVSGNFQIDIDEGEITEALYFDGGQKHIIVLNYSAEPTAGDYNLEINGEQTSAISYSDTAVDIETKINSLSFIATASVQNTSSTSVPQFEIYLSYSNSYTINILNNTLEDSGGNSVTVSNTVSQEGEYRLLASEIQEKINNLRVIDNAEVSEISTGLPPKFEIILDYAKLDMQIAYNDTKDDTGTLLSITKNNTQEGEAQGTVDVYAENFGEIPCPEYSLTEINNPVTGFDRVMNYEKGQVGDNIEDDVEVKQRRQNNLANFAGGTLEGVRSHLLNLNFLSNVKISENDTNSYKGDIPPKSFKTFVVPRVGDTLVEEEKKEVAKYIWDKKPAGIQPYGDNIIEIYDTQDQAHDVGFSYPVKINIYLSLQIKVTDEISDFTTFADRVKDEIISYGNEIGVGEDVIVYPYLIGAISNIKEIKDVIIDIGTSSPPSGDDNINIDNGETGDVEVSNWLKENITISEIT